MLEIEILPAIKDNYVYLLRDSQTGAVAAVDPSDADVVISFLEKTHSRLHCIINTHHHWDHTGGNIVLKEIYGCPIFCSEFDLNRIPGADQGFKDKERFSLGSVGFEVLSVPGHTLGHIALYADTPFSLAKSVEPRLGLFREGIACLFTGDTFFSLGCGRLFEGTHGMLFESLQRLSALPGTTAIFCGHEYTEKNARFLLSMWKENEELKNKLKHVEDLRLNQIPTLPALLSDELRLNPFLGVNWRPWVSVLSLPPSSTSFEVFCALRSLRDVYS